MIDELRKRARKNNRKKKGFQIILTIYACFAVLLFAIGTQAHPEMRFWINFPTLIFLCVLAVVYVSMFGFRPIYEALNEPDNDIEEEINRLYEIHIEGLELRDDLSIEDKLELEHLERIREKLNS